ncbi:Asp-tRNA(Asn)/Glu-tRNA(Gln) amidotransferase subunit GatC [Agilicoccus flavus]|uniref:Asp-tRNA(Asn)/Glu-tRNA(Gln) amidotransferase subunit GatC n=1 Tax=Agilicoccus flavus TaxID=2775968 RepID=UPI001CF6964A|nr:Asp-tRNA(Asn)/Glu-tRNA(Gln) amidotransferase subunit GatC [Agilicoccus flavus]
MTTITRDQVEHLAMLARIDLTDEETTRLATDLGVILEAVEQVGEVASDDVPPMSHPLPLVNVLRADEVRPSLAVQEALSGAPEAQDDRFVVPRILGEE